METNTVSTDKDTILRNTETAVVVVKRGYQPIPLRSGTKRPMIGGWTKMRWENSEKGIAEVRESFDKWANEGQGGIGVLLGEPSGGLVDVDLDHPATRKLKDHFLPYTAARSGRASSPSSHYWYIAKPGTLQATREYKAPTGLAGSGETEMIVEYRSTGSQTAIPGNLHETGETYVWSAKPWGGDEGPAIVNGQVLAMQVALLGFGTLLVEHWPGKGARHETFLALAGALLRVGEGGVHPYWERNARVVIEGIADATMDEDGAETRVQETVATTIRRLHEGGPVAGWGKLAEILGEKVADQARIILGDIESLAGLPPRSSGSYSVEAVKESLKPSERGNYLGPATHAERLELEKEGTEDEGEKDPLDRRKHTWEAVDLEPYLTGQVQEVEPTMLHREDGQALMYPGRLNMLYGPSEAAKSWLAMFTCVQLLERGERVVYLDLEDEPVNAIQKMRLMGAKRDDLAKSFVYVRPEEPLAAMQRNRWGKQISTEMGETNERVFWELLEKHDPTLIVADGMTMLYGLHGLDTNDTSQTDIITSWLKSLSRNGRSTVLVVDHTAKNPQRGSMPIGSQHKAAMVQGSMLQTYPVAQPMPGAVGEVELILLKDRPGKVRMVSEKSGERAQLTAKFIMDSTQEDRVKVTLEPPSAKKIASAEELKRKAELDLRASREAERIERLENEEETLLRLYGGELGKQLPMTDLMLGADEMPEARVRSAVARLMDAGWLLKRGSTKNATYELSLVED